MNHTDFILHGVEHNIGAKEKIKDDCPPLVTEENHLQPLETQTYGRNGDYSTCTDSADICYADKNNNIACYFYTTSGMPRFNDLDADFTMRSSNDKYNAVVKNDTTTNPYSSLLDHSSDVNAKEHNNRNPLAIALFADAESKDYKNEPFMSNKEEIQCSDRRNNYQTLDVASAYLDIDDTSEDFSWIPQSFCSTNSYSEDDIKDYCHHFSTHKDDISSLLPLSPPYFETADNGISWKSKTEDSKRYEVGLIKKKSDVLGIATQHNKHRLHPIEKDVERGNMLVSKTANLNSGLASRLVSDFFSEKGDIRQHKLEDLQQEEKEEHFTKLRLVSPLPCSMPPIPIEIQTLTRRHTNKQNQVKDLLEVVNCDRTLKSKKEQPAKVSPCSRTTASTRYDQKRSHRTPFAKILLQMITETEATHPSIMRWICEGKAFIINDSKDMLHGMGLSSIIAKYFSHGKFKSLVWQLNVYGFYKGTKGKYRGAFRHPWFCRDVHSPSFRLNLIVRYDTKNRKLNKHNKVETLNCEPIASASENMIAAKDPLLLPQHHVICKKKKKKKTTKKKTERKEKSSRKIHKHKNVQIINCESTINKSKEQIIQEQVCSEDKKTIRRQELPIKAESHNNVDMRNHETTAPPEVCEVTMKAINPLHLTENNVSCRLDKKMMEREKLFSKKIKQSNMPILNQEDICSAKGKTNRVKHVLLLPQNNTLCSASASPLVHHSHTITQLSLVTPKKRKAFITACNDLKEANDSDGSVSCSDSDYNDNLPIKIQYKKNRRRRVSSKNAMIPCQSGDDTNTHQSAAKNLCNSTTLLKEEEEEDSVSNAGSSWMSTCTTDLLCRETFVREDVVSPQSPSFVTPPGVIAFEKCGFE